MILLIVIYLFNLLATRLIFGVKRTNTIAKHNEFS
jgi:hypothetical protein